MHTHTHTYVQYTDSRGNAHLKKSGTNFKNSFEKCVRVSPDLWKRRRLKETQEVISASKACILKLFWLHWREIKMQQQKQPTAHDYGKSRQNVNGASRCNAILAQGKKLPFAVAVQIKNNNWDHWKPREDEKKTENLPVYRFMCHKREVSNYTINQYLVHEVREISGQLSLA